MTSANSLKKCGCHLSGPGDLFGFRSISFFHTISGVMSAVDNVSPGISSDSSKILSNLSVVNTLQKNSFSESAFSFGVVAFDPSDFKGWDILPGF